MESLLQSRRLFTVIRENSSLLFLINECFPGTENHSNIAIDRICSMVSKAKKFGALPFGRNSFIWMYFSTDSSFRITDQEENSVEV